MKFYYDEPKQVKFLEDVGDGETVEHYGIAYQDVIICGCCGGIIEKDEVSIMHCQGEHVNEVKHFYENNEEENCSHDVIEVFEYWIDLSDAIIGE